MATIVVHKAALADLNAVWDVAPEAAATIQTLLQEAKANASVLDSFTIHDFGAYGTESYNVSRWIEQQRKGRNLWRLKIWELERYGIQYRVVYAFDPRIQRYFVLGIFDREFDYDESDSRTQRVLTAYDRLDIPKY